MTTSKQKRVLVWGVVLVVAAACAILLIPAIWCGRFYLALQPKPAPENFPAGEIIYNAGGQLGFANSDGSVVATVPFDEAYFDWYGSWQSPLLTGDGSTVVVTHTTAQGYPGKILAQHAGQRTVDCGWAGTVRIAADGYHILVDYGGGIAKYAPEDCGTGKPPEKTYPGITGALSPDEQYAAEVRETRGERGLQPYIVIRNLITGEEKDLGESDFPVWSRDGQSLAYTGVDGIYIIQNSPDAEARLLVSHVGHASCCAPVYVEARVEEYYPPIASWSPDGKWLVYQLFSEEPIDESIPFWAKYYSLFKVNVETGETVKLLDGGYAPYWRWPVEQP
jgi:hypothetical protein